MSLPNSTPPAPELFLRGSPILCYVTDRRSLPAPSDKDSFEGLLDKVEETAAAGIDWIQLREKDLSAKLCARLTREALHRTSQQVLKARPAARIIVNDRLDVASAERAGGAHLGENSLPVLHARRLTVSLQENSSLPDDFLLGASCHSLDSANLAAQTGADYVFFGPIFSTPSKAAFGAPQSLERLAEVCAALRIPVLAIGGITLENAASCISAGAKGIAAIRLFQDAADPDSLVRHIRRALL